MASRGRERRGRPRGASQAPPVFDQQAFVEDVGIAAAAVTPRPDVVHSTCNCKGVYVYQVSL